MENQESINIIYSACQAWEPQPREFVFRKDGKNSVSFHNVFYLIHLHNH